MGDASQEKERSLGPPQTPGSRLHIRSGDLVQFLAFSDQLVHVQVVGVGHSIWTEMSMALVSAFHR